MYVVVPYNAYAEGDFVETDAAIVSAKSRTEASLAVHAAVKDGSFPPELQEALEGETFGGNRVERADGGAYYVTGEPEDEDEEPPVFFVSIHQPHEFATIEEAENFVLRSLRVHEPTYWVAKRGHLSEMEENPKVAAKNSDGASFFARAVSTPPSGPVLFRVGDRVRFTALWDIPGRPILAGSERTIVEVRPVMKGRRRTRDVIYRIDTGEYVPPHVQHMLAHANGGASTTSRNPRSRRRIVNPFG